MKYLFLMTAKRQHIAHKRSHVQYVNSDAVFLEPFSHTADILVVTIKVMQNKL